MGCAKANLVAEHYTVNGVYKPTSAETPSEAPSPMPTDTPTPTPVQPGSGENTDPTPTAAGIIEGTPVPEDSPTPGPGEENPTPTAGETVDNTPTPKPTETPTPTFAPAEPTPTAASLEVPAEGYYSRSGNTDIPSFVGVSYVLADSNGTTLLSYNAGKRMYPASTVKMLTALVAIDYLNLDSPVTATSEIVNAIPQDQWNYGVVAGMDYSLSVWMHMLMVESCGDAAFVIAYNVGAIISGGGTGNVDAFIAEMNNYAKRLGMNDTYVDNPVGLDIGNGYNEIHSTAADMVKLGIAYMKNDALADLVSNKVYTVPDCKLADGTVVEGRELHVTNAYYDEPEKYNSDLFYSNGIKSGSTNAAGYCYVASLVSNSGRKLYLACFGVSSPDSGSTAYDRSKLFEEMTKIAEYGILNE